MALQNSTTMKNLYLYRGLIRTFNSTFSVTVFPGVQPSAANIVSSWTSYNTQYLAHWPGATWYSLSWSASTPIASLQTPLSNTAYASGEATWGILWSASYTEATIQGGTLPGASFMVVPVTDTAGNGIIRLSNTTVVSSSSCTLQDLNLSVNFSF